MYRISFSTATKVVMPYLRAQQPVLLIGDPGVGKSTFAADLAAEVDLPLVTVIASTCDPTDFGGFPVVRPDGAFDRIPMRAIKQASESPVLLFVDELTTAPPAVQATLLRGILDRVFGDVALHLDTRILAAANPPDQAPGGSELSAPLVGRFAVFQFSPTLAEFQHFLESQKCPLHDDFAATLEAAPDLVQFSPPPTAINEGQKWPSPRDWHRALVVWAAAGDISDDIAYAITAGSVGENAASGYMGIRRLRANLPTISEIIEIPEKARVPGDPSMQIGALGLLAQVAAKDAWAAWIYAARLTEEIGAAAARMLVKRRRFGIDAKRGQKAMIRLLGKIGAQLA